jgi:hypothetical protein
LPREATSEAPTNRVGVATVLSFSSELDAAAFLRRALRRMGSSSLRRVLLGCAPSLGNTSLVGDARLIAAAAPRLRRGDFVVRQWERRKSLAGGMDEEDEEVAPAEAFVEPAVVVEEALDAGPQEEALLAAAEAGSPFCEECEKARREQEAAA